MKVKVIKKANIKNYNERRRIVYAHWIKVYHQLTYLQGGSTPMKKLKKDIKGQKKITGFLNNQMK